MKKLLAFFLIIHYCFCSMEECENSMDINSYNNIEIEYDDLYFFKGKFHEDDETQCLVMPKNKENQKFYFALMMGISKELLSCFVTHEEENGVSKEEYLQEIEENFVKLKKESYNLDETVEFEKDSFTSKDKDIFLVKRLALIISMENIIGISKN